MSKVSYADGTSAHGLGDVYLAVKLGLLDPAAEGRSFGLAVAPVVELLSSGSLPEGRGRVQWALPVAMEKRFEGFRVYGSVGYFSRGAIFGSAAVEVPVTTKLTATATLSHSRSLEDDPLSDELELAPSRWDVSGGAAYFFSPRATFFASVGRTVSQPGRQRDVAERGRGSVVGLPAPAERPPVVPAAGVAEREGFEPSEEFPPHMISSHADSARLSHLSLPSRFKLHDLRGDDKRAARPLARPEGSLAS